MLFTYKQVLISLIAALSLGCIVACLWYQLVPYSQDTASMVAYTKAAPLTSCPSLTYSDKPVVIFSTFQP
jgi:spore maturation protein CgeB